MNEIRFTLIADGSSDKTLLRIIKWLLDNQFPKVPSTGVYADFRYLDKQPKTLIEKLKAAKIYYPYDILFVHRDAETTNLKMVDDRMKQLQNEIGEPEFEKTVCVIPVKMMETWLMIDKEAIKKAAGNRNYPGIIDLPPLKRLEKENQPKKRLHELLERASGLKGRNLHKFNVDRAVHLVAENITDFSPLRGLVAFNKFELSMKKTITNFLQNQPDQ